MATVDNIEKYLPKTGLFRLYHDYTSGSELCPRFRFFAFAAIMGSLIKRKVWFQRSSYGLFPTLYPNLWIILVAPQGRGHKSTALSMAKKLIQELPDNLQPRFLASKLTPEALVKALATQAITPEIIKNLDTISISILKRPAQALLYSSELGVLLGKEKYNQGMIALLTDLYDTPNTWESETVMRGDQKLYDVCLSVMGASTPDWMQTMLPSDAFKGGFMSRLLLVGYPEGWHVRISDPLPPDEKLKWELVDYLTSLTKFEGEMTWDKEAKAFFDEWYIKTDNEEPGPKAAYLERKQDQLLRLSMLLQLSFDLTLCITRQTIEQALGIMDSIEPDSLRMVEYISIEPRMRVAQRLLEIIQAKKEVVESELLTETWRYLSRPQEFNEVIEMLLKTKRIAVTVKGADVIYIYKEEKK